VAAEERISSDTGGSQPDPRDDLGGGGVEVVMGA